MGPLIAKARWRLAFLAGIVVLLLAAMATVGLGWVKVKMLPFDNKSEFQIILNMPEGSALERHRPGRPRDCRRRARRAGGDGLPGLYRRRRPLQLQRPGAPLFHAPRPAHRRLADQPRAQRRAQGPEPRHRQARPPARRRHRRQIRRARRRGRSPARPAGPADARGRSLWAERGEPPRPGAQGHRHLPPTPRASWTPTGISRPTSPRCASSWTRRRPPSTASARRAIAQTLQMAVGGSAVDLLHLPREKEDVQIMVRLPQSLRTSPEDLLALRVRGANPASAAGALARTGQGSSAAWWTRASTTRT